MKSIDLNCDMGELMPGKSSNFDSEIMPFISSCNISCGFHSGNPKIIADTVKAAISQNVSIGAHPSYNDRENFGRKSLIVDFEILKAELTYQISAIKGMVESLDYTLSHVKPHGALYNDMVKDDDLCDLVVKVIKSIDPDLKIYVLAGSSAKEICKLNKMQFVNEGFADRRYDKVDQLRSRSLIGAVVHKKDEVLNQIDLFTKNKVKLYNGELYNLKVDSICLHSDTAGAIELSKNIFNHLRESDVNIASMG